MNRLNTKLFQKMSAGSFLMILVWNFSLSLSYAANSWQADIPVEAKDPKPWISLLGHLYEKGNYFGALSAANRMLLFFNDITSKESAYRMIIQTADQGYPFSIVPMFSVADINPQQDYNFVNNFNFYKYIFNSEKGLERWAKNYFSNIDTTKFTKYIFYTAIVAYNNNKLDEAESILKSILSKEFEKNQLPFVRKVARTLARLYFERSEYSKALDIYQTFLLKLNPITPSDWLEAAWNLYYLKRYQETLGYLYNLESTTLGDTISLEKYTIRGLVYRDLCSLTQATLLSQSFDNEFGNVITGIKKGESLKNYSVLNQFDIPSNAEYQNIRLTLNELQKEQKNLSGLSSEEMKVAQFFYKSEINFLSRKASIHSDQAQERAAIQLILLSERLRFLRFDVARQKFNPDDVFREDEHKEAVSVDGPDQESLEIHWKQFGDYWRDERLKYKGTVKSQCAD